MSDQDLRALERAAAGGDPDAEMRYALALLRSGQVSARDVIQLAEAMGQVAHLVDYGNERWPGFGADIP